jgi:hypothetical protein
MPLEFNPEYIERNSDRPVVYNKMVMGKDVRILDENFGGFTINWRGIVRYDTKFRWDAVVTTCKLEAPTGHLKREFNRFYTMEWSTAPSTPIVTDVTTTVYNLRNVSEFEWQPLPSSDQRFMGIIVATSNGSHAMGVFAARKPWFDANPSALLRPIYRMRMFLLEDGNELNATCNDEFINTTSKWTAAYHVAMGAPVLLPNIDYTFRSYILTETYANVVSKMGMMFTHFNMNPASYSLP